MAVGLIADVSHGLAFYRAAADRVKRAVRQTIEIVSSMGFAVDGVFA